jgi:hypothetical protein
MPGKEVQLTPRLTMPGVILFCHSSYSIVPGELPRPSGSNVGKPLLSRLETLTRRQLSRAMQFAARQLPRISTC